MLITKNLAETPARRGRGQGEGLASSTGMSIPPLNIENERLICANERTKAHDVPRDFEDERLKVGHEREKVEDGWLKFED